MTVARIDSLLLDDRTKGIPGGVEPFPITTIGQKRWNVLREDLPLPLAILRQTSLDHNSQWMRRYLELSGTVVAPHGKTSMSPQIFQRQLDDGAWGITVANVSQLQVARDYGVRRVLLANQLIGRQPIRYVLDELARDPEFDFYCLADSLEAVAQLADAARARSVGRPVQVLVEGGFTGGRTGCRELSGALAVARAVKAAEPHLTLRGVGGYEGIISDPSPADAVAKVRAFIEYLGEIAVACEREQLFAPGPLILTAGGTAFFDLVTERFAQAGLHRTPTIVIRSGCYLTHDSAFYTEAFARLVARSPQAQGLGEGLRPAIEVWAYDAPPLWVES